MKTTRLALTLVELIVVLSVVVALSAITVPLCNNQLISASETATRTTLAQLQVALQQYWKDTKFIALDGVLTAASENERFEIEWMFHNPMTGDATSCFDKNTGLGWNGPYLLVATFNTSQPGLVDAWNRPLQVHYVNPADSLKDVRIVSAGENGVIDIPANVATSALTPSSIGDDLYVALRLR
jgi:type II secretory pathway pseudopilin PulG